jgi:hypothetical protein
MFVATAPNLQNALVYDPRYMEFDHWASLLCEQYAAQQLSVPDAQTDWKSWAAGLLAIDVFINQNIPSPYSFDDWQEWASALLNVMNGGR